MGQYGDVIMTSYLDVWRRPHDVICRRMEDFSIGRPHDFGKGRRLALYREPHVMFFGDVLKTSSERKFAEWVNQVKN